MHLFLEIVAIGALLWLLSMLACVAIVRACAEPSAITLGGPNRRRGARRVTAGPALTNDGGEPSAVSSGRPA